MIKKTVLLLSAVFLLNSCLYMMAYKSAGNNGKSIHFNIRKNNFAEVEKMLMEDPSRANLIEDSVLSCPPLVTAAYDTVNGPSFIRLLLSYGADPNLRCSSKYKTGKIAFETAVAAGSYESARILIDGGTDLDILCSDGKTILEKSFDLNEALVIDLLEKGAVPKNDNLLFRTLSRGYSGSLFLRLEQKGLDIFRTDENGQSLLHSSAVFGSDEISEYLIYRGLDVNRKDKMGETPLHKASVGSICLMKIGGYQSQSVVPVFCASEHTVSLLLNAGALVDSANNYNETPLHLASRYGHLEVIRLLVSAGADVNAVDSRGYTPVLYSALGIDIDIQNSDYPPYHSDNPAAAEYLIENGADPYARTPENETALDIASRSGASDGLLKVFGKYIN